jgi:HSP20 family protein
MPDDEAGPASHAASVIAGILLGMPRDADRLHEEIEDLFNELWQVPRFVGQRRGFRPNVDSYRTTEPPELTVVVELPGVDPAGVQVVVDARALLVSGERPRPKADGRVYEQMEIEYGPFQRLVRLPADVDPEHAKAEYERGVLRITLPVIAKPSPGGRVTIEVWRG